MNIQGSRGAGARLGAAARDHAHDFRDAISASRCRGGPTKAACTTVEHQQRDRQAGADADRLPEDAAAGIPFSDMFAMKEYPQDVLPLYAQGHSLAEFLIGQRGKRAFLTFLADGMADEQLAAGDRRALRVRAPARAAELVDGLGRGGPAGD